MLSHFYSLRCRLCTHAYHTCWPVQRLEAYFVRVWPGGGCSEKGEHLPLVELVNAPRHRFSSPLRIAVPHWYLPVAQLLPFRANSGLVKYKLWQLFAVEGHCRKKHFCIQGSCSPCHRTLVRIREQRENDAGLGRSCGGSKTGLAVQS